MSIPDRAKTPLALVVLALAALAYTHFVDRSTVSDADRAARVGELFPTLRVDLVKRVELTHAAETLVLERSARDEATWEITSPRRQPADASAVDSLLRELELAKRVRTVSAAQDLGAPRVRGRVTVGPIEYLFVLGADAPQPSGAAYMRVEGEATLVVAKALKVQLLRTADAYRARALVPYGQAEIERVEWTTAGGTLVLQRAGDVFRVDAADGLRASRSAVESVFGALADARVDTFLDDTEADHAAPPLRKVTVVPRHANRPRVDLAVGGACPGRTGNVVVARSAAASTSACVARGTFDALETTPDNLVDRGLVYAHPDEIEEVLLESNGAGAPRVDIARRGAGWHERAPFDRDLDLDEVGSANALVTALAGSQAVDAKKAAGRPALPVRSRATLVRTGSGTTEVIEISSLDATGQSLAVRRDDGALLHLSRSTWRRFEPHPATLHAPAVWTTLLDPLQVTAVDDTCTPEPERLELRGDRWTMRLPPGLSADTGTTMDVVDTFAHARAARWVAEGDDGTFGLGASGCAVTLTLADAGDDGGKQTRSIVFGSEEDGSRYAQSSDRAGVFLASSTLREVARHPAVDRRRFRIEATDGTRVTLSRDGARIVLAAKGGTLARAGAPADVGVDKLAAAVLAFYARDALHAGPPAPNESFDRPTLEIHVALGPEAGPGAQSGIVVGGAGRDGTADIYFARVSGIDATFAVAKLAVSAILEAW